MTLTIEAGKFYRTRDGRKVGPMVRADESTFPWTDEGRGGWWREDGTDCGQPDCVYHLVSEWNDGPVREVTRKEIVPGVYGRLQVGDSTGPEEVAVRFVNDRGKADPSYVYFILDAAELRAAAATLTEIADALDEGRA